MEETRLRTTMGRPGGILAVVLLLAALVWPGGSSSAAPRPANAGLQSTSSRIAAGEAEVTGVSALTSARSGVAALQQELCEWYWETLALGARWQIDPEGISSLAQWIRGASSRIWDHQDEEFTQRVLDEARDLLEADQEFVAQWQELGPHPEGQAYWEKVLGTVQTQVAAWDKVVRSLEDMPYGEPWTYEEAIAALDRAVVSGQEAEAARMVIDERCQALRTPVPTVAPRPTPVPTSTPQPSGTWHIEVVTPCERSCGWYHSLALDGADRPHIGYYEIFVWKIKYAHHDGTSWIVETPDEGDMVSHVSLALDASGYPHMAFYDEELDAIEYAYYDGTQWHAERVTLERTMGPDPFLALDSAGRPHISYPEWTRVEYPYSANLWYAYHDGTSWQREMVDVGLDNLLVHPSLALDSAGRPHISYQAGSMLGYACHDGSRWQTERVAWLGDGGCDSSLALDSADRPHISYYDSYEYGLKYAWYDHGWQIETVGETRESARCTSLALDRQDRPHIGYWNNSDSAVKYAWQDGTAWQVETVDSGLGADSCTSLALDSSDQPHVSYWDKETHLLKYARRGRWSTLAFLSSPCEGNCVVTAYFDHSYPTYRDSPNCCSADPLKVMSPYWSAAARYPAWYLDINWGFQCDEANPGACLWYSGHDGHDYAGFSTVLAAATGRVAYVGCAKPQENYPCPSSFGLVVDIDHENGYLTRYGHLHSASVKIGERVGTGQRIGVAGRTGFATGVHLHFMVYDDANGDGRCDGGDIAVDPYGPNPPQPDLWREHNDGAASYWLWVRGAPASAALAPDVAGALVAPDGDVRILIPAGAVASPGTLYYTVVPEPRAGAGAASVPTGKTSIPAGHTFHLSAADRAGNALTTLLAPTALAVWYTEADLAHVDANSLGIYLWNESASDWELVPSEHDPIALVVSSRITQLGLYSLRGNPLNPPPMILSIDPMSATNEAATAITIRGSGFLESPFIRMGEWYLPDVHFLSDSTLTGTVPAGLPPGNYDLTVENPDGQSGTLIGALSLTGEEDQAGQPTGWMILFVVGLAVFGFGLLGLAVWVARRR